jgi:hypothetical protein
MRPVYLQYTGLFMPITLLFTKIHTFALTLERWNGINVPHPHSPRTDGETYGRGI